MSNQNQYEKIRLEDIRSPESFRSWLKKNLSHLYMNKVVPGEHLLIFLDYVRAKVENDRNIDRVFWLSTLRDLESKIKSLKRTEENNEL